jgi:phosphoserine phosphatase
MKTIICDIDGTIFKYSPDGALNIVNNEPEILPGVQEIFNKWEAKGCRIILITGRRENLRNITETTLTKYGIPFDILLMGFADTGRVLINDTNWEGKIKAHAVNLNRDDGLLDYNWKEVGL